MANLPGPQPDVQFCPKCKGDLRNVVRLTVPLVPPSVNHYNEEMRSRGYKRKDGRVSRYAHTYECRVCKHRFEINQEQ